jgi:hypothetical protein
MIQMALGGAYADMTSQPRRNCPTHTAMIVEDRGELWIADVVSPRSKLTELNEYEADIAAGQRWNLQIFRPVKCDAYQQERAAAWWVANRRGRLYDWPAFPRLALKAVFGDIFPCAAGLEWSDWCTESVMLAYRDGAKCDNFHNANPTPLTVIKRWGQGVLAEVLA